MPPFTVLHVCMGNICRSPMAERLLARAVRERVAARGATEPGAAKSGAADPDALVHSHSAGTGGWHVGSAMNPPAARLLRARGVDCDRFGARRLSADLIDGSDLVLTATAEQWEFALQLRPDAAARTFVLGEFGRLLAAVDPGALPAAKPDPDGVYARGVALVAAVDAVRGGAAPRPGDDLDDPYGLPDATFARIADEIEATVRPLAALLLPEPAPR
ncbi:MAG TPA: phosphotyrosine protein phosphatase [Pilimelia sp.]|nr:phosphotyrosine protein phosphatase [Pilimelia sp.]